MKLRLLTANSLHGINQLWEVIECENIFLIGRKIIAQYVGEKQYISWQGSKRNDFHPSWDAFKEAQNIKSEITSEKIENKRTI